MYFGMPCYGYVLNCLFVYLVIPGIHPLFMRKHKLFILFTCNLENEIHFCSNKHETGLVHEKPVSQQSYDNCTPLNDDIFMYSKTRVKRPLSVLPIK